MPTLARGVRQRLDDPPASNCPPGGLARAGSELAWRSSTGPTIAACQRADVHHVRSTSAWSLQRRRMARELAAANATPEALADERCHRSGRDMPRRATGRCSDQVVAIKRDA